MKLGTRKKLMEKAVSEVRKVSDGLMKHLGKDHEEPFALTWKVTGRLQT